MARSTSGIGPEYWLRRAAEVRRVAEQTFDPEAKRTLEKLAAEYEELAKRESEKPD
jgi:hypothetical protein